MLLFKLASEKIKWRTNLRKAETLVETTFGRNNNGCEYGFWNGTCSSGCWWVFPHTLNVFPYVFVCFQGKKMKADCTGYVYIYSHIYFTTDPLDLNIQINTKTTKIALFCRNIVGFWHVQPCWGAHESLP